MLRHLLCLMASDDDSAEKVRNIVSWYYTEAHHRLLFYLYFLATAATANAENSRWSLGSLLFLCSWGAMLGPMNYVKHLMSTPRLPFTCAYFGSIGLTMYFSLGVSFHHIRRAALLTHLIQLHSTILTLISALVQMGCLTWYLVSYFPMGSSGLRLATSFGASRAAA